MADTVTTKQQDRSGWGSAQDWPPPGLGLPTDADAGVLIGRIWRPDEGGPSVVRIRDGQVWDITRSFATVSGLCASEDPAQAAGAAQGTSIGTVRELLSNTPPLVRDPQRPWFLAPVDLQTLKAAGVTFAVSLLERVIEERAGGDLRAAARLRGTIHSEIGTDLSLVRPGSRAAARLADVLRAQGLWSQYLEVGIGPDAEVFTKAPTLAAVGTGVPVGIPRSSSWNNPEPEVALIVGPSGSVVGATLGNDVNLRDVEGRSALLLPRAKDNNASCALGPFVRLFDDSFDLDAVRAMSVRLEIRGQDGFQTTATSEMRHISRDPLDLVDQVIGPDHQYPDGIVLMLGTMFAPVVDRDAPGMGFTHHEGDVVTIAADELGALVNQVLHCHHCEPWIFGIGELMRNLAGRGLLTARA